MKQQTINWSLLKFANDTVYGDDSFLSFMLSNNNTHINT